MHVIDVETTSWHFLPRTVLRRVFRSHFTSLLSVIEYFLIKFSVTSVIWNKLLTC